MQTKAGDYISADRRKRCRRCGAGDLGWYQNKAGRWYLCRTLPSQDDRKRLQDVRYLAPWAPHSCEAEREQREKREAEDQRRADAEAQVTELYAISDALADGDLHGAALLEDAYRTRWGR